MSKKVVVVVETGHFKTELTDQVKNNEIPFETSEGEKINVSEKEDGKLIITKIINTTSREGDPITLTITIAVFNTGVWKYWYEV